MPRMLPMISASLAAAFASSVMAADIVVDCPQQDALPPLTYVYTADTLTLGDDPNTLPAFVREDPDTDMMAIRATGETEAPMPEPVALDACIDERLKKFGFDITEEDVAFTSAMSCRNDMAESLVPTRINIVVEVMSMEKGSASVFTSRTYVAPSALLGKPIEISEWPLRNCTVTGP